MIDQGLCPFAHPVFDKLLIEVYPGTDVSDATTALMAMLDTLSETSSDAIPTALLVTPALFSDFDEYWNWLHICDTLLQQMGYEGELQLASFHPQYLFEGEDPKDPSHFTNRSPYPMVHILREDDLEQTLLQVSSPEKIPERNRLHLRRLGLDGILQCMPELKNTAVFANKDK